MQMAIHRFRGLTEAFSKKLPNLKAAVALYFAYLQVLPHLSDFACYSRDGSTYRPTFGRSPNFSRNHNSIVPRHHGAYGVLLASWEKGKAAPILLSAKESYHGVVDWTEVENLGAV